MASKNGVSHSGDSFLDGVDNVALMVEDDFRHRGDEKINTKETTIW